MSCIRPVGFAQVHFRQSVYVYILCDLLGSGKNSVGYTDRSLVLVPGLRRVSKVSHLASTGLAGKV